MVAHLCRRALAALCAAASLGALAGCTHDLQPESTGDAVMLSDNTRLSLGASGWTAASPGVTANVIQAHETTRAAFEEIAPGTLVFEDVPAWRSNEGDARITLRSSLQTGVAEYDGAGYAIGGLGAGPAFAETDTLTVESSEGVMLSVPAPAPLADPATLLGEPRGLRTEARIPDGIFDTMYVFVAADDGAGGDDGVMRFVPAAEMALVGDERTAPLLDDTAVAELEARGMTPVAIYVAYYNELETGELFDGRAVPVQAGRMFQVDPADL